MSHFNRFDTGFCGHMMLVGGMSVALAACAAAPSAPPAPASAEPVPRAPVITTAATEPVIDVTRARAVAPQVGLRSDAPLTYVVKRGDTLWGIAAHFLEAPWQWPVLWYDNPQVENPHLIYPGDVLRLVWVNGQPRLTRAADAAAENVERLSPRVRETTLADAIPAIPFAAIRDFLKGPRLVDAAQIQVAPYVVGFGGEHLIGAAGHDVFAKHLTAAVRDWQIMHIGKAYRDPDSGKLLGYEAVPVARATLVKPGQVAQLHLMSSTREVLLGDVLFDVLPSAYHPDFVPHAPGQAVAGSIISVFGGLSQIGQYQIVTLNRGRRAGLDAGSVLQIMQAPREVPDPRAAGAAVRIPAQPAGLMMVFEVAEHLSYALVMQMTGPAHVLDRFTVPDSAVFLSR